MLGYTLLIDRLDDDLRRIANLSLTEYEILVRLSEREGQLRMAQLADALAHSRSRVTHTIKRMEEAGLVERSTSPDDGRGVIASLTEKGWQLLRDIAPIHVDGVRDHLVDLVSDEDFAALGRVMNAVADHLIARASRDGDPGVLTEARRQDRGAPSDGGRASSATELARPRPACRGRSRARSRASSAQSRVSRRWVTRCGRAASSPRRSILFSS